METLGAIIRLPSQLKIHTVEEIIQPSSCLLEYYMSRWNKTFKKPYLRYSGVLEVDATVGGDSSPVLVAVLSAMDLAGEGACFLGEGVSSVMDLLFDDETVDVGSS